MPALTDEKKQELWLRDMVEKKRDVSASLDGQFRTDADGRYNKGVLYAQLRYVASSLPRGVAVHELIRKSVGLAYTMPNTGLFREDHT